MGAIHHAGFEQGTDSQVGRGGVAAGVGHQPRRGNPLAVKLRQAVDRFGQKRGLGMGRLVPGGVVFRGEEAKGAAEVHHARSGAEHGRGQFHGDFRWGGQKYQGKPFLLYGSAGTRDAEWRCGAAHGGRAAGVFPVIHEDWFHVRVAIEEVHQFRAAVASIPDNSDPLHV